MVTKDDLRTLKGRGRPHARKRPEVESFQCRLSQRDLDQIDAYAERLRRNLPQGLNIERGEVVRVLLHKGLELIPPRDKLKCYGLEWKRGFSRDVTLSLYLTQDLVSKLEVIREALLAAWSWTVRMPRASVVRFVLHRALADQGYEVPAEPKL